MAAAERMRWIDQELWFHSETLSYKEKKPGLVAHACNLRTLEAEV